LQSPRLKRSVLRQGRAPRSALRVRGSDVPDEPTGWPGHQNWTTTHGDTHPLLQQGLRAHLDGSPLKYPPAKAGRRRVTWIALNLLRLHARGTVVTGRRVTSMTRGGQGSWSARRYPRSR